MNRARFRLTLRESAGLVAIAGLVLALTVQGLADRRRIRRLEREVKIAGAGEWAQERMNRLMTSLGRYLLGEAQRAEYLAVAPVPLMSFRDEHLRPTGRDVPSATLRAIADALLDSANYRFSNADDEADPQGGLRIRRGSDTLDVLWSEDGGADPGHQDIWFILRDSTGRIVHNQGYHYDCLGDARLGAAIQSLKTLMASPAPGTGP